MITPPSLIDAHPGDPITSEQWNNVLEAVRRIYAGMNKSVGALAIKVVNPADNNPIRGAIVTVKPIDPSTRVSFGGTRISVDSFGGITLPPPSSADPNRPTRPALFVGAGENYYQVSQLVPGAYDVVVEAAGFNRVTKEITMPDDGNPLTINMPMVAAETLFPMPNLFGMTLTQALAAVNAKEFQVIRILDSHGKDTPPGAIPDEAKTAMVLGQVPDPGTSIAKNTPIQIHISAKAEYAERIKVPDLRGLTLEEAKAKLELSHLVLGKTETVRSVSPKPSVPSSGSTLENALEAIKGRG